MSNDPDRSKYILDPKRREDTDRETQLQSAENRVPTGYEPSVKLSPEEIGKKLIGAIFCIIFSLVMVWTGLHREGKYFNALLAAMGGAIFCLLVAIGKIR